MIGTMGLVPVALVAALASGGLLALIAGFGEPLVQRLGSDPRGAWRLLRVLHMSLVLCLPLGGAFTDHTGAEYGVIVGALLAATGIALIAVRDNQTAAVGSALLLAAGAACLSPAAAVLFVGAFLPGQPVAALNLGYVAVGLAWLAMPAMLERLLASFDARRALLVLALACLLPAGVAALTPVALFPLCRHGELANVFQAPVVWVAGVAALLYLPVQGAMARWTAEQLPRQGYSPRGTAWLTGTFWIAFLAGRALAGLFVLGPIVSAGNEPWLLLLLAICAAVGIGNLAGAGPRASLGVGLVLIGLFCGPIYPTLLGAVMQQFPNEPGTAFGITAAVGSLGNAVLLPLAQRDTRRRAGGAVMRVPLVSALLVAAVALVWALILR